MEWFSGGEGEVGLDVQHWPFVFATWRGTADVGMVDRYFDAQERITARALAEGARVVMVSDALDANNPPATARKRIAERSDALQGFEAAHAASFVVLRNTFVRGALTAIQWLSRSALEVQYVGSCAEAIELGSARLDELGIARPPGLRADLYVRPIR